MNTLPKIFKLKKTVNKLFNKMLETYFVHEVWRNITNIPTWALTNTNDVPIGWTSVKTSKYCKSELEKADECLAFMRHLSETYNEDVICFEFPRNHPVPNKHPRMHFTTIGSLSTYAVTGQKPSICIVYDMDSFRKKDNVTSSLLVSSHRPHIVYYLE